MILLDSQGRSQAQAADRPERPEKEEKPEKKVAKVKKETEEESASGDGVSPDYIPF
jgi:hypothetical protein